MQSPHQVKANRRTLTAAAPSPEPTPANFDWPLANEAEDFLRRRIDAFLAQNSFARDLAVRMEQETGTDFFEWVDHLALAPEDETELKEVGFDLDADAESPDDEPVYEHPRATLPRVLLRKGNTEAPSLLALRPEFVADFIARNTLAAEPAGEPCSRYRRVVVASENGTVLNAVERRAYRGFVPGQMKKGELEAVVKARELWRTRPRVVGTACQKNQGLLTSAPTEVEGFAAANKVLDRVLSLVGRDMACHFFFEAERAYWESRNSAGRLQKFRQDNLGLGWGNHDHHTFRCSRQHFTDLIQFLSKLGFIKRERYYAGAEAGWGAQILEQPVVGIVVFADVDLMPDETQIDFSVQKLPPAPRLGTVGLWVGLHGESFLEAGMHHLEARFDFDALRDQLKDSGVNLMKPFSNFAFLRQAFTEGERWPVQVGRIERLLNSALITGQQAELFLKDGALGSHLENLQRHGGFKGFNQKSVSVVIAATDPRRNHFKAVAA